MGIEAEVGRAVLKFLAGRVVPAVGHQVLSALGIVKNDEPSTVRNQDRPGIELGVNRSVIGLLVNDAVASTGTGYGEVLRALLHEVHGSVQAGSPVLITVPGSKFSQGRWEPVKGPKGNKTDDIDVMFYDEEPSDGVVIRSLYGPLDAGTGRAMAYYIVSIQEYAKTQTRA